jgi:hypothetical protein
VDEMREIKFRYYDKTKRVMRDWDYVKTVHKLIVLEDNSDGESYSGWMQYTGFRDKNGTEIYEGDIIRSEYYYDSPVVFKDGCFMLGDIPFYEAKFVYPDITFEVIGNIYEHPHLLSSE